MQQYGGCIHWRCGSCKRYFLRQILSAGEWTQGILYFFYEITDYVQDLFQELNGEQFKQSVSDLHQAFQELEPNMDNSTQQNLVLEKSGSSAEPYEVIVWWHEIVPIQYQWTN